MKSWLPADKSENAPDPRLFDYASESHMREGESQLGASAGARRLRPPPGRGTWRAHKWGRDFGFSRAVRGQGSPPLSPVIAIDYMVFQRLVRTGVTRGMHDSNVLNQGVRGRRCLTDC